MNPPGASPDGKRYTGPVQSSRFDNTTRITPTTIAARPPGSSTAAPARIPPGLQQEEPDPRRRGHDANAPETATPATTT